MNEILEKVLKSNEKEHRPIPFWSWNNALSEEELVLQIKDMKKAGIGGFIMHARTGLSDEYLGEKWFSCIDACLKKARELDMQAWIYDENGWPSGFVGGKLLENESFRARFLEYSVGAFDSGAYAVYIEDDGRYSLVNAPESGISEYHNIYLRVSHANTDILNPIVVDAFIAETHERYYERFAESFGRELAGFFTDEPQFYRYDTPYTHEAEKYIPSLREKLIWLFLNDERGYAFRREYYGVLNRLYVESFYKKLYSWCDSHNCKLTGHSIEESALFMQMWGGGAVMPTYEFEHIPAIDALGRRDVTELSTRQITSVCAQKGIKKILTETFACSGYDVTPRELRSIGESQFFGGVNMLCHHLYPYSIAGQGKVDHPPVFGPKSNWGEAFKGFNDYFSRLGALVGATDDIADIGIIHPMHSIWLSYIRKDDYESVKDEEAAFAELLLSLRKAGVTYHFIDESILKFHGRTQNNKLVVGNVEYGTVLLPKMTSIDSFTYELLKGFKGNLCVAEKPRFIDGKPSNIELCSNTNFEDIINARAVRYTCSDGMSTMTHRIGECGEFLFVKNFSSTEKSTVLLEDGALIYKRFDVMTGNTEGVTDTLMLEPSEGIILIAEASSAKKIDVSITEEITDSFKITNISDNYFVLDYARVKKSGEASTTLLPIPAINEELLREDCKGVVIIEQTFVLNDRIPISLIMEKLDLISAELNGHSISFEKCSLDINFREADISEFVCVGENRFVYSLNYYQHEGVHFALFDPLATESLRNCLYFDTSIENSYLRGDFIVNDDMSLSNRECLPKLTNRLNESGYPFFMGTVELQGEIEHHGGENTELILEGRFLVAEVEINGENADFGIDLRKDITKHLKNGKNHVKITLRSSLRNLFGPHHFAPIAEPMGVSPYNFTMRGSWKDRASPDYTDRYNSVDFGISNLFIKRSALKQRS